MTTDNENPTKDLKWYNTTQISEMFGVQPATIRFWIHSKQIKAVRIGNKLKVEREELVRFANTRYVE